MQISSVRLRNFKCFEDAIIHFAHGGINPSKWCVVLGENGCGKSAVLQGIALALMGPLTAQALFNRYSLEGRQLVRLATEGSNLSVTLEVILSGIGHSGNIVRQCNLAFDDQANLEADTEGRISFLAILTNEIG